MAGTDVAVDLIYSMDTRKHERGSGGPTPGAPNILRLIGRCRGTRRLRHSPSAPEIKAFCERLALVRKR